MDLFRQTLRTCSTQGCQGEEGLGISTKSSSSVVRLFPGLLRKGTLQGYQRGRHVTPSKIATCKHKRAYHSPFNNSKSRDSVGTGAPRKLTFIGNTPPPPPTAPLLPFTLA